MIVQDDEDVKPPISHTAPQNAVNTDIIELEARIAAHEIRMKFLAEQVQSPQTVKEST